MWINSRVLIWIRGRFSTTKQNGKTCSFKMKISWIEILHFSNCTRISLFFISDLKSSFVTRRVLIAKASLAFSTCVTLNKEIKDALITIWTILPKHGFLWLTQPSRRVTHISSAYLSLCGMKLLRILTPPPLPHFVSLIKSPIFSPGWVNITEK